ncbi:MAG: NfeD family protein [Clostridiales bacterium]|nr:NfeD family protein [Clostridiales bacterium]
MTWTWIWAAVMVAAAIVEAASVQLISIWFALGGLVALVLSLFDVSQTVQIIAFAAVSVISLAVFWPLAKRLNKKGYVKTNSDRFIGETAVVTQSISNVNAQGQVKVDNQIWTARSENGENIQEGALVIVKKIEGVKLIVSIKNN